MSKIITTTLNYFERIAGDDVFFNAEIDSFHEYYILNGSYQISNFDQNKMIIDYEDYVSQINKMVSYRASFYGDGIAKIKSNLSALIPIGNESKHFKADLCSRIENVIDELKGKNDSRKYLKIELGKLKKNISEYNINKGIRDISYKLPNKYNSMLRNLFQRLQKKKFINGNINQWMSLFTGSPLPFTDKLQWLDITQKTDVTNKATLIFLIQSILSNSGTNYGHGNKIISSCFIGASGEEIKNVREAKNDSKENNKQTPRFIELKGIITSVFNK